MISSRLVAPPLTIRGLDKATLKRGNDHFACRGADRLHEVARVNNSDLFNVTQIATLLGKSKAVVSRRGDAGDFDPPYIEPGATFKKYSISAVERAAGRTFSAAEIEAARSAHYYQGPKQREINAAIRQRLVARTIADRDCAWEAALNDQNIFKFTPPPTKGK